MSFPNIENLTSYLDKIIELESNIPVQYRSYWYNHEWAENIRAYGFNSEDGSHWILTVSDEGAVFKSYLKDQEKIFGYTYPQALPEWALKVYNNSFWNSNEITSFMLGYHDGKWEEPWLATAWWPIDEIHHVIPFDRKKVESWLTSLGLTNTDDILRDLGKYWSNIYKAPELDLSWEALEPDILGRDDNCDSDSCNLE